MTTPAQKRYLELLKKRPEIKQYFEEMNTVIKQIINESGFDASFQDGGGNTHDVNDMGLFASFEDEDGQVYEADVLLAQLSDSRSAANPKILWQH